MKGNDLSFWKGRLKSIFWIDGTVVGESPDGPSGPRRECAVQAFLPQAKTLAEGRLRRPEHSNTEGWRPPPAAGTQNKRQLLSQLPFVLVRLEGFEPATFWFVAKHSIQLSYSRNSFRRGLSPDGLISIAQKRIFGKCFFKKFFLFLKCRGGALPGAKSDQIRSDLPSGTPHRRGSGRSRGPSGRSRR